MNCTTCEHYNRGKGMPACLSCPQYQDIVRRSFKRHSVRQIEVPETVLEQIAADSPTPDISATIDQLPDILGDILTLKYYRKRTHAQIGRVFGLSERSVSRKVQEAIDLLRGELE